MKTWEKVQASSYSWHTSPVTDDMDPRMIPTAALPDSFSCGAKYDIAKDSISWDDVDCPQCQIAGDQRRSKQ
jgi:hypothetical protein